MRREKKTEDPTVLKFRDRWVATVRVPADYPGTRIDYWDTKRRGFGLRVSGTSGRQSDTKIWFIMYRCRGVKRRLNLGVYQGEPGGPVIMKLAKARSEAEAAFGKLAEDKDPAGEKPATDGPVIHGDTFEKIAALYLQERKKNLREGSWKEYERGLNHDLLPVWRHRIASTITRADVKAVVASIEQRGAITLANRTISLVSGIFNWAIKEELLTANPATKMERWTEHPREVTLDDNEVRTLWMTLDQKPFQVASYFRLCLLTAQRRSEVLGMTWSELDLKAGHWRIPGERTKNHREHTVPLGPQAFEIIQALRAGASETDGLVFTEVGDVDNWLEKFRLRGINARPHDLRTTATTIMTRNGVSEEDVGRILNHTQGGVTGRHYNMYPYQKEKRNGLRKLDAAIRRIVEGRDHQDEKVVALHAS
jgi:integrase